MSERSQRVLRIILSSLVLATLAFIFTNSALPKNESSELSHSVGGFLARIFPPESLLGGFLQEHLRKIAHFAEYGLLGAELSLYSLLFVQNKKRAYISLPIIALTVAFLDESVQMLSGRGPAILDVWIDLFGFLTAVLVIFTAALLSMRIRAGGRKSRED